MPSPLYFGPADRPLFGWLHGVARPARLGLVVCSPFGYEAVCAHRALRHFAAAAAQVGVPALRFDYDGTGDSAGDDRDPDRVGAWIRSIGHAADALRRTSGVERVCLLGVRLGALLAAQAALGRDDYEGLIAVAPVTSGKAYARELKALQMATATEPAPEDLAVAVEGDEALGFLIAPETKAALSAQDLLKLDRAPARAVLILDRSDLPSGEKWAAHLSAQGVAVEREILPGYVEMMLDADKTSVPEPMIAAAQRWLQARQGAGTRAMPHVAQVARAALPEVVETAVSVDDDHPLAGILAEPATARRSGEALVLLNAGGVHHIGPNRLWVSLARRWAAAGHVVLRCDLSGVGDSAPRPDEPENAIYTAHAARDIEATVAWVRRQRGVERVSLIGLCSGAYHAFKAAAAGAAIDGVVCINPLVFFYEPEASARVAHSTSESSRYLKSARDLGAWKKLLRGEVHFRQMVRVFVRRGSGLVDGLRKEVLRRLGVRLEEDLAAELRAIDERGIALRFVFAGDDPGLPLLRTQGGATVERLREQGRLSIEIIPRAGHTFTAAWAQAALVALLGKHFG